MQTWLLELVHVAFFSFLNSYGQSPSHSFSHLVQLFSLSCFPGSPWGSLCRTYKKEFTFTEMVYIHANQVRICHICMTQNYYLPSVSRPSAPLSSSAGSLSWSASLSVLSWSASPGVVELSKMSSRASVGSCTGSPFLSAVWALFVDLVSAPEGGTCDSSDALTLLLLLPGAMLGFLFLFEARDFPLALVGYYAKKH